MTKQGTILVVDDNKGILTAVQMLLGTYFEKVITISTYNPQNHPSTFSKRSVSILRFFSKTKRLF